jgi:hypothetical protein
VAIMSRGSRLASLPVDHPPPRQLPVAEPSDATVDPLAVSSLLEGVQTSIAAVGSASVPRTPLLVDPDRLHERGEPWCRAGDLWTVGTPPAAVRRRRRRGEDSRADRRALAGVLWTDRPRGALRGQDTEDHAGARGRPRGGLAHLVRAFLRRAAGSVVLPVKVREAYSRIRPSDPSWVLARTGPPCGPATMSPLAGLTPDVLSSQIGLAVSSNARRRWVACRILDQRPARQRLHLVREGHRVLWSLKSSL